MFENFWRFHDESGIRYWQKRSTTLKRIHEELQRPPARTVQPEGASGLRVRISPYHVRKIVEELTKAESIPLPPASEESDQDEDPLPATRAIEFYGSLTILEAGVQAITIAQRRQVLDSDKSAIPQPDKRAASPPPD